MRHRGLGLFEEEKEYRGLRQLGLDHIQREAERKDNRDGEGKERWQRGAERKRKRDSHPLFWLLTEFYFLVPIRLFISPLKNKHLYSTLFKIKTTKI